MPTAGTALAVKGKGASFNEAMMAIYSNLTAHMPEHGMQVVHVTHQDAGVWAELAMTLWAAGLKVTAAWTVATETTDGLNAGANDVQGTVLLVLRKRGEVEAVFDDELLPMMEDEVRRHSTPCAASKACASTTPTCSWPPTPPPCASSPATISTAWIPGVSCCVSAKRARSPAFSS